MSSALNRRAALGILSMGSVAFLAACGSDKKEESNSSASASTSQTKSSSASSPASATPSASESPTPTPTPTGLVNDGKDYSGVAKLEQYETPGEYQPATAESPAQNVPTPVIPEAMHQNTVAGFASALAYFGAAVDYLLQTGDMKYVRDPPVLARAAVRERLLLLLVLLPAQGRLLRRLQRQLLREAVGKY